MYMRGFASIHSRDELVDNITSSKKTEVEFRVHDLAVLTISTQLIPGGCR